jgi:hypothetical protein
MIVSFVAGVLVGVFGLAVLALHFAKEKPKKAETRTIGAVGIDLSGKSHHPATLAETMRIFELPEGRHDGCKTQAQRMGRRICESVDRKVAVGSQRASLAWVDELGRLWRKPSDILERPELAYPDPQGQKPTKRD